MSLLHEALKKAEKEKGESGGGEPFVDSAEEKKPSPIRLYLLVVLTVAGLLFVGALQLFHKGAKPMRPAGVTSTPFGIAGGPGIADLTKQSDDLLREARWAEAEDVLQKWIVLEPRNAEAYNNLGLTQKKLGKRVQAAEQYRKALTIQPDYPEVLNNLGVLYLGEGKLPEAQLQFQKAMEIKPDLAEPYFHLALISEAQGRGEEAIKNYRKFLEISPRENSPLHREIRNRMDSLGVR